MAGFPIAAVSAAPSARSFRTVPENKARRSTSARLASSTALPSDRAAQITGPQHTAMTTDSASLGHSHPSGFITLS